MKKINLKGISEILSEKEMKNVLGGSGVMPMGDGAANNVCDQYHAGYSCITPYGTAGTCRWINDNYSCV